MTGIKETSKIEFVKHELIGTVVRVTSVFQNGERCDNNSICGIVSHVSPDYVQVVYYDHFEKGLSKMSYKAECIYHPVNIKTSTNYATRGDSWKRYVVIEVIGC